MITLTIGGEELELPESDSPFTLTWEGTNQPYRAGPPPRGHSIIGDLYTQVSGHWELRDTPAPWPFSRSEYLEATSLNLGTVEYGP